MTKKCYPVSFFEIPTEDNERASAFYHEVFGWSSSSQGGGNLWALTGESDEHFQPLFKGFINGDFRKKGQGFEQPLLMIMVDSVDEILLQVQKAGGKVELPPQDERKFGGPIWAVLSDTEGNHIGIYSFM